MNGIHGLTTEQEKEARNKTTTTEGGITTFRNIDDLINKMESSDKGHIVGQFYIDTIGDNKSQTIEELRKISFGWIIAYIQERKITFSIHGPTSEDRHISQNLPFGKIYGSHLDGTQCSEVCPICIRSKVQ